MVEAGVGQGWTGLVRGRVEGGWEKTAEESSPVNTCSGFYKN